MFLKRNGRDRRAEETGRGTLSDRGERRGGKERTKGEKKRRRTVGTEEVK